MSWRQTQLQNTTCDQDRIILNLYRGIPVRYIGKDLEFAKMLSIDYNSRHAVAVFNTAGWLSELINLVQELKSYNSFYLGVNRYLIKGNNTNIEFDSNIGPGKSIINLVEKIISPEFTVRQSGNFDNDQGKFFNFVQPLTWIYATNNHYK